MPCVAVTRRHRHATCLVCSPAVPALLPRADQGSIKAVCAPAAPALLPSAAPAAPRVAIRVEVALLPAARVDAHSRRGCGPPRCRQPQPRPSWTRPPWWGPIQYEFRIMRSAGRRGGDRILGRIHDEFWPRSGRDPSSSAGVQGR
jgi:hypothetical protein